MEFSPPPTNPRLSTPLHFSAERRSALAGSAAHQGASRHKRGIGPELQKELSEKCPKSAKKKSILKSALKCTKKSAMAASPTHQGPHGKRFISAIAGDLFLNLKAIAGEEKLH